MRKLSRTIPVVALAAFTLAPALSGQQQVGSDWFKWYIGPQVGVTIFETPSQTKGAYFTAGGHFLIMSKRTGLLISVDEAIASKQSSSFADTTSATGSRSVKFSDLRKFSAVVLAFPFRSQLQPFVGIGLGIMQTGTEYPSGATTPTEKEGLKREANNLGSYGFATVVLGVQARAGSALGLFGQAAVTTAPGSGKLITGSTYAFTGGLRISLGSSREDVSGNGY